MWLHDKAPGAPRAANQANGHSKSEASLNSKLIVSNLHYEITPKDLIVRTLCNMGLFVTFYSGYSS
jgi:THO complex subunit 4